MELLSELFAESGLKAKFDALVERANNAPKEISGAADLEVIGPIVVAARDLWNLVEATRKKEKAPILQAEDDIDGFFRDPLTRLKRIQDYYNKKNSEYSQKLRDEATARAREDARKADEEAAHRRQLADAAEAAGRHKHADTHDAKAAEAERASAAAQAVLAAPVADLTRRRTASGVLSTAKIEWTFEITDYAAIDLNALRMLIKREAVEAAIAQAVKNGVRTIPGVSIKEGVKGAFR